MREEATKAGEFPGTGRGHDVLPHTADTGLRAWAPDLPGLFEEAAGALAEIAAEVAEPHDRRDARDTAVAVEARDLVGLAFAWLSELVGLADATHSALVETRIARIEQGPEGWRLEGCARFVGPHPGAVRPRHDVKSATYHGLAVERMGGGWSLTAYLDI
jgi:SHS2 domain-containing protein